MKQKQINFLSIGLGVVIIINVLLFGCLLTDFFSTPNGPKETVAATDSVEETTGEETTLSEEITSQDDVAKEPTAEDGKTEEQTAEDPTSEETIGERIKAEIPFSEIEKVVVREFSWGNFKTELGYSHSDIHSVYPMDFMVGENVIGVVDNVNYRIMIYYNGQYHQIPLSKLYTEGYWIKMSQLDDWITVWNYYEDKLMLYRLESGAEIHLDLSAVLNDYQEISAFLEIGNSYIVWSEQSDDEEAIYRYDWLENKLELVTFREKSTPAISMEGVTVILGTHEDSVYYYQYGDSGDRYTLNRETPSDHLYTEIEFALYLTAPLMYLSPDGHLYMMEMFEDGAKISEIKLAVRADLE